MADCAECAKYEGKEWLDTLRQIAVLAPHASYPEIMKMLAVLAEHLGHPQNTDGLEHLLLHLMVHEQEKSRS